MKIAELVPEYFLEVRNSRKSLRNKKTSKSAGHGGGGHRNRRQLQPSTAATAALQPGFSYKCSPGSSVLLTQSVLTDAPSPLRSFTLLAILLLLFCIQYRMLLFCCCDTWSLKLN
ncbi:hypothetical protein JCGZ_22052 [Jatropha curcas]|uniref:Uncharacterized protein n=1 Tax=Jatropha curcas TaxID=180498 RepID=A0A067LBN8_JATCU|nr:hypothetical protein JCGZ_22052 [Jatropha curcas]